MSKKEKIGNLKVSKNICFLYRYTKINMHTIRHLVGSFISYDDESPKGEKTECISTKWLGELIYNLFEVAQL